MGSSCMVVVFLVMFAHVGFFLFCCLFLYRLCKHFFILILIEIVVRINLGKKSSYAC